MTLKFYDDDLRLADGAALPLDTVVQPGSHRALVVGIAQARRRLGNLPFPQEGYAVAVELGVAVKRVATNQTSFLHVWTRAAHCCDRWKGCAVAAQ